MLADHILYFDTEALVVDKPAGLPVDPPRDGGISVVNHLQGLALGNRSWPIAAHRLDRDTSGCLLFGRSDKAHKRIALAFEQGLVAKRYLAILDGMPDGEEGEITLALAKQSTKEDGWRIVADPKGKAAVTRWQLLAESHGRALVAFTPTTGRTHQLRVHAASGLGHAITGDIRYGTAHPAGLMLHAADIALDRAGKARVAAHAPFPARFAALGFTDPDAD